MTFRAKIIFSTILALALVVGLGLVIIPGKSVSPIDQIPKPNGYDELIAAGSMLGEKVPDSTATADELRAFVSSNRAALDRARSGLLRKSRVPTQFSEQYVQTHLSDLASEKRIVQAFVAEGRLADLENRPTDALRAYLNVLQVGCETRRGGLMIDELVAIAIEAIGTRQMKDLQPKLDAAQSRDLATALEKINADREPFDSIIGRERALLRSAGTGRYVVGMIASKSIDPLDSIRKKSSSKRLASDRTLLEIQVAAAVRAYELDKGAKPTRYEELVPVYLKRRLLDPETQQELKF